MYLKTEYDGMWWGAVFDDNGHKKGYLMDFTVQDLAQKDGDNSGWDMEFNTEAEVIQQYKKYCEFLIAEGRRKKECEAKSKTYEYKDGEVVPYELPF